MQSYLLWIQPLDALLVLPGCRKLQSTQSLAHIYLIRVLTPHSSISIKVAGVKSRVSILTSSYCTTSYLHSLGTMYCSWQITEGSQ